MLEAGETRVQGFHGDPIAGTVGVAGPEPTLEWAVEPPPPAPPLAAALASRLGSEARPEAVIVAGIRALRGWLAGEPLERLLGALAWPLRQQLATADQHLPAMPAPASRDDLVRAFAAAVQRRPVEAERLLGALLAAIEEALPGEVAEALEGALPDDVAALRREAR